MSEISIPHELVLDPALRGNPLSALLHLLVCEKCWTAADLHRHGYGRASVANALESLTRQGHYRRNTETLANGETLVTVELAIRPGEFSTPVVISRVYFVGRENLIKIGTTADLPSRLYQLEREGGPLDLLAAIEGGPVLEDKIHEAFARYRVHGEWFRDCQPLRHFIAEVAA